MKFIFPSILVLISLGLFFTFTKPQYDDIQTYQDKMTQYDSALGNEARFERERDSLSKKFHNFPSETEDRMVKALPDNVQNIQLVIALQQIAQGYGMNISGISFGSVVSSQSTSTSLLPSGQRAGQDNNEYGTFDIAFTVAGNYEKFLVFLKKLESSLRILDIQSVDFSSDSSGGSYTYTVKLKTYWFKS